MVGSIPPLIDAGDKAVGDFFDLQDEIVARLANTLNAQLVEAEARRAERSPHPDSMDLFFQGQALWNKGPTTLEHLTGAYRFFERALALEPENIEAIVGMANAELAMGAALLIDERIPLLHSAEENAIKALSLRPDHAGAHSALGFVYIFTNRAALGLAECEHALSLNHNSAGSHSIIGYGKYCLGRAAETEGHILQALRLSPRDLHAYWWMLCLGMSKIQLHADAEGVSWLQRSVEANRNFPLAHFILAAALALTGSLDQARLATSAGLALDPFAATLPIFQAITRNIFLDGEGCATAFGLPVCRRCNVSAAAVPASLLCRCEPQRSGPVVPTHVMSYTARRACLPCDTCSHRSISTVRSMPGES